MGMRIRLCIAVLACLLLAGPALAAGYDRHLVGDPALPTPNATSPGLLLMGGGDRNHAALRWFLDKAGNGHVVVLRASLGGEIGEEFHDEVGGVASVETFVFRDREAASDPAILASLARADGIFIAGGDQSRYVRFWRGTPVAAALDAHVRAGKPLGGTSAGLAILGEFVYGAMDGGSLRSPDALADPLGDGTTIETGMLHIDALQGVVTDTHFRERGRLGRLFAFVAKAETLSDGRPVIGLGVDEDAALAVEADGRVRVHATAPGAGATVVRGRLPAQEEDAPMRLERIDAIGVGVESVLHLPSGRVERPMFQRRHAVRDGVLVALDAPLLVIHGGAGVERAGLGADEEAAARGALAAALRAGHAELEAGRTAVDAVAAAIQVLEDAPQFNAGRGAVFTHDGHNELDASLMEGATGRAGAIAGVRVVRNPILLARAVMEHSRHVMMVGAGAESFAASQGLDIVDPAYFRIEKRWQQLQKALREEEVAGVSGIAERPGRAYFGTVGAVALDAGGHLAAGTSTGGMTNKRWGRVGDSPIIGAGTWADAGCAVSGTGWGEFYIRTAAAHEVCARVRLRGERLGHAAEAVINGEVVRAGGDGGAIAIDAAGNVAFPFNTEGMYRGWIGADGVPHVAVFAGEALPLPQE